MITERELNLMRGWDELSLSEKRIAEYLMANDGTAEGSQASIGRLVGDNQPANVVRAVKGLIEKGIVRKEFVSSTFIRLYLNDDYDEVLMGLGE